MGWQHKWVLVDGIIYSGCARCASLLLGGDVMTYIWSDVIIRILPYIYNMCAMVFLSCHIHIHVLSLSLSSYTHMYIWRIPALRSLLLHFKWWNYPLWFQSSGNFLPSYVKGSVDHYINSGLQLNKHIYDLVHIQEDNIVTSGALAVLTDKTTTQ